MSITFNMQLICYLINVCIWFKIISLHIYLPFSSQILTRNLGPCRHCWVPSVNQWLVFTSIVFRWQTVMMQIIKNSINIHDQFLVAACKWQKACSVGIYIPSRATKQVAVNKGLFLLNNKKWQNTELLSPHIFTVLCFVICNSKVYNIIT